VRFP
jgi:tetratricopeptide (TPR) repeat protein